ncbi:DMT family transporter [Celeribacter neptunius]|uniref:EamA-like transporter family protein n=1 Tax=Celeribacter neptunius TaxID=588602 RepID=A0A1I3JPD9_9RHOB|nr:DMT family transporter [Celeribacter neptunius]SFI62129.1 EamA-like transporter family protein [Celeribacter neptunius]
MTSSPDLATLRAGNLKGALLMVLAMGCFALEDMAIKRATAHLPVGEVLVLFGLGGMAVFSILTLRRRERIIHPVMAEKVMILRAGFEIMGRVFFTLSLALTALSTTSAILQATPLMVAAAGVVFFHERVTLTRWALIALGFLGVLLVIRPGLDGFTPLSILAVLGMIGFAGRDLTTRAAPTVLSYAQLGVTGFAALVASGLLLTLLYGGWIWPSAPDLGFVALAVIVGVSAYTALTMAMRMGELSVVTPFRYIRLLFAMALGALVFGERPDALELAGGAVIVGAGVLLMLTARRR